MNPDITIQLLEYVEHPLNHLSPYTIYLILYKDIQVGTLIYRTGSNEERYFDGHIGYTIDEAYRGHHYAYDAVKILLKKITHDVILTCEEGNIASKKTIERLNAQYLETLPIPSKLKKQFSSDEHLKRIYLLRKENF